jgi:hypothetical protein
MALSMYEVTLCILWTNRRLAITLTFESFVTHASKEQDKVGFLSRADRVS